MNNIKNVDIRDIDLDEAYFHFTPRKNLEGIDREGLKAKSGDASKMIGDDKARVYLSRGGKGLLKIKDTFIWEFENLRICDIPMEYREYFDITDYSSTEQVKKEDVYSAMERKFKDEVYLNVDAIEGEDFLEDEIRTNFGTEHDIQGKENHNIDVKKISVITTPNGNSALDVIEYMYNKFIENCPEIEDIIRDMHPSLEGMFEYIKQRDNKLRGSSQKSTQDLGRETLSEQKDVALLDEIEAVQESELIKQNRTEEKIQ